MSARIVDGKGIADAALAGVKTQLDALHAPVHLAAVAIGDDEGVRGFLKIKQKAAQSVGVTFSSYLFSDSDRQAVGDTLRFLAADDSVHGIFVELPLPHDWDRSAVLALIPPGKDVDALTDAAVVPAPAVIALQHVLNEIGMDPRGMRAAVIGHGSLIGQPVARWLTEQGAHVDIIDIRTADPHATSRNADILVAGAGVPGMVTADWVKEGALVVDYGYARSAGSGRAKFVGDIDAESVKEKAGFLTPVPGGMGPLVVAAVLENLVTLATR